VSQADDQVEPAAETAPAEPAAKSSTYDAREKLAQADALLQRNIGWVLSADQKASFLLAFAGVLLGAGLLQFATIQNAVAATNPYRGLVWTLVFVALASTAGCAICALSSSWPRIASASDSLVYFGTARNLKLEVFRQRFLGQTDDELLKDVLDQAHVNAQIATKKHQLLSWATGFMLCGFAAWVILFPMLVSAPKGSA